MDIGLFLWGSKNMHLLHKLRPMGVIKLWFGISSILLNMGSHCWDQVRPHRKSSLF